MNNVKRWILFLSICLLNAVAINAIANSGGKSCDLPQASIFESEGMIRNLQNTLGKKAGFREFLRVLSTKVTTEKSDLEGQLKAETEKKIGDRDFKKLDAITQRIPKLTFTLEVISHLQELPSSDDKSAVTWRKQLTAKIADSERKKKEIKEVLESAKELELTNDEASKLRQADFDHSTIIEVSRVKIEIINELLNHWDLLK